MRKTAVILFFFLPITLFAQKQNDSLVTSIGWVIHVGDSLQLSIGTMDNGRFKFIRAVGAWSGEMSYLPNRFGNNRYRVTKLKVSKGMKIPVIAFRKVMGMEDKLDVEIEGAIASGEIVVPEQYRKKPQSSPTLSKADELVKLKKLLDDGVLTKEEFEAEKKKLLEK